MIYDSCTNVCVRTLSYTAFFGHLPAPYVYVAGHKEVSFFLRSSNNTKTELVLKHSWVKGFIPFILINYNSDLHKFLDICPCDTVLSNEYPRTSPDMDGALHTDFTNF